MTGHTQSGHMHHTKDEQTIRPDANWNVPLPTCCAHQGRSYMPGQDSHIYVYTCLVPLELLDELLLSERLHAPLAATK